MIIKDVGGITLLDLRSDVDNTKFEVHADAGLNASFDIFDDTIASEKDNLDIVLSVNVDTGGGVLEECANVYEGNSVL